MFDWVLNTPLNRTQFTLLVTIFHYILHYFDLLTQAPKSEEA